ncbi:hypothetical protein [cf. Phormidesmis sp. LEGE 11477]|uniref:hypothetical protein n=1 Tax=cf. Phormidesmis sp. LEGE 11477 TaxID=1828680 RepID=UPI00187F74BC|nr:hypothetical protein [cf. Phormidesmis sp. LEGE 11477]MBE9060112.1 hypothetical protein [cf. Phormidesmis sp. LEGE 11477]
MIISDIVNAEELEAEDVERQVWQGRGQIIQGRGVGAVAFLEIEIEGKTAHFLSGPSAGERVPIPEDNRDYSNASNGRWKFRYRREDEMIVTFTEIRTEVVDQPNSPFTNTLKVIEYILVLKNS